MKISLDNALSIHPDALKLRAQRANVLAGNIAQADTPGFKARDVDFQSTLSQMVENRRGSVRMRTTHAGHQGPSKEVLDGEIKYRVPTMPSLDGNTVDMQAEQARFAENNMQFLASLRFVSGRLRGLTNVIRGE